MSFAVEDFSDWSLLGEGGEAQVFRARQVSLDRLVAIKRLKLTKIGDEEEIRRFEREAKLCASLPHPSLVQIFDYGSDGRYYYLVMEYVQGIDLGKMSELGIAYVSTRELGGTGGLETLGLPTDGPGGEGLPASLKVHLARQMAEVVEFIHQKGVLHRDLKPENFMADLNGRLKLLDLGMAKAYSPGLEKTDPHGGGLRGTLAYMPPEILRGGRLDPISEYYSLALVILEIFSGTRFYRGKSIDEVVSLIQSGIAVAEMDGVPAAVKALLTPYLNPDPARRPRTLEPMQKGLKAMLANTLALAGGREALEAVIRAEQRAWLWTMVRVAEASGEFDQAFQRLRELLESDPGDAEVQAKFRDLGVLMNEAPESAGTPAPSGSARSRPSGARLGMAAAVAALLAVSMGAFFYLESRPVFDDAGRELLEREMSLLSKENEPGPELKAAPGHRPALKPFGVLIVTGVPENYQVLVNKVRYRSGGEIHLPASRHLIEIQDPGSRSVLRDSVAVEGGEPTVYDFSRRAGKQ
jgi:hypothetical protein